MIFVTVGTHEQQFNRLIQYMDERKGQNIITECVVMQTGYSTYEPRNCQWKPWLSYHEMQENISRARIVITHGGPSSFMQPLQMGKIPVVVPRQKKYGEHVNDHQLQFCKETQARYHNIIVVEEIQTLEQVIGRYDELTAAMSGKAVSNNETFNRKLRETVRELFGGQ